MFRKILNFYIEGFRTMPRWGRILWIIIIVKLFIIFGLFKVFFFSNTLSTKYDTNIERTQHVIDEITN